METAWTRHTTLKDVPVIERRLTGLGLDAMPYHAHCILCGSAVKVRYVGDYGYVHQKIWNVACPNYACWVGLEEWKQRFDWKTGEPVEVYATVTDLDQLEPTHFRQARLF